LNKLLDLLCGLLAGVALFAIMALTFFDVIGRKLLANSIPGSLELTELLMVVVIFAGLPLVSRRGEHVEFDSLDPYLPGWVRRAQQVIVQLVCAAVLLGLAWRMAIMGMQFGANGEITAQLYIPKAPFIYGMAVLCGITGLVHLAMVGQQPVTRGDEPEGAAL
jgi:TRAP-type C4-dicarboxylate transport system permease small subunit